MLIDDGSDDSVRRFLHRFTEQTPNAELVRNAVACGYTHAANQGLRYSTADYTVLLNSDTILTKGWLERMIRCGESDPHIGIVGPLSNAASYQSVPELAKHNGSWKINTLPNGWSVNDVARNMEAGWQAVYPRVPILNGFCLAIKRKVIDRIGYLDEETFPGGYGEENDYCFRATASGFQLAVSDDVYIYHKKSKSFSSSKRSILDKRNGVALVDRYGKDFVDTKIGELAQHTQLRDIRRQFDAILKNGTPGAPRPFPNVDFRILFLLPVKGFCGGVHSVIQEARGLLAMGTFVQVAIPRKFASLYKKNYPNHPCELFFYYGSENDLVEYAQNFNVCTATIFSSVSLLKRIVDRYPKVQPAYYIQDYEPWFFAEDSPLYQEALQSYTLLPNILAFAKTSWLVNVVQRNHGIVVHKVEPSLDHDVYFPRFRSLNTDQSIITISAMIRPNTPWRAAPQTMALLKNLYQKYRDQVRIELFGVGSSDAKFKKLDKDFVFTNHGLCTQREVAEILRSADIFADLSVYQAFGRTALEAMACGCAVVLPELGGAKEYAQHERNCIMVDTTSDESMKTALHRLIENPNLRNQLKENGISTTADYSVHKASLSMARLFQQHLIARQNKAATNSCPMPMTSAHHGPRTTINRH